MKKLLFTTVFVVFLSTIAQAQQADRSVSNVEETGLWVGLYLKGKINDKWFYYGEHHYRRRNSLDNTFDFVGRMRQVYNRAGINYVHNEYFNVVLGPTFVLNYTPQPGNPDFEKITYEPRIWHQWLFSMPYIGRMKLYHQFRFEHRWKRDNNVDATFDYTDRYRYKVYAYIPLNKPKLQNKTWFLAPSAEIFLETGKSKVYNQLEDFRVYTGLGYILNSKITFFGGHMWTIGTKASGFEFRESHIIRLNVFYNFDLRNPQRIVPSVLMGD
jgi:opacity protein-like surface antigen